MRKITISLLAVAIIVIGFTFHFSSVNAINKPNKPLEPLLVVKGQDNPEKISDWAAQEAFLRSLTAAPGDEVGQRRARSFAIQALGEEAEDSQVDTLLSAAQKFVDLVSVLDLQVKEIKDTHWPQPSEKVKSQLRNLQKKKEEIIADTLKSLAKRIKQESKDKVDRHVVESVKRKITATTLPPPEHQQHPMGMILSKLIGFIIPTASAQGFMGEGFIYSNSSYNPNHNEAYGYGATTESYSSYGHQYQITVNSSFAGENKSRTTPSSYYSSPPVSATNVFFLCGASCRDGLLSTSTSGVGYCYLSYSYFGLGYSGSNTTIAPYVRLNPYTTGFIPSTIRVGDTSNISISVTSSQNFQNNANLEFSHVPVSVPENFSIGISGSGNIYLSGSQTETRQASYTARSSSVGGRIKADVVLTAPAGATVVGTNTRASNSILTINQ